MTSQRSLTIKYPFIKHIPIAIVMSISHISGCATIYGNKATRFYLYVFRSLAFISCKERLTVGYQYRAAPDMATTGNRANDTPVQSQSER